MPVLEIWRYIMEKQWKDFKMISFGDQDSVAGKGTMCIYHFEKI